MNDKNFPYINPISEEQAEGFNPLVLAFIGDSVQTLYVRSKLALSSTKKAGALHIMTSKEINAGAQAEKLKKIYPLLNEKEIAIFKRTRNSKVTTPAKHASIADYKTASGYEAVLGYLFITGQEERLSYLLENTTEFNAENNEQH